MVVESEVLEEDEEPPVGAANAPEIQARAMKAGEIDFMLGGF